MRYEGWGSLRSEDDYLKALSSAYVAESLLGMDRPHYRIEEVKRLKEKVVEMEKTPGQEFYEKHVNNKPMYCDGTLRPKWKDLPGKVQKLWSSGWTKERVMNKEQENSGIDAATEVEVNKSEEDLRKEVYALENQVSYYKDQYDEVCKQLEETKKTRSRLGIPLRLLKWYLSGIRGPGSFQFWDRKRKRINWFNHKVSDLYVKMWRAKFSAEPIDNPWKDILGRW